MPVSESDADMPRCDTRERDVTGTLWRVSTTWTEIAGRMEPTRIEIAATDDHAAVNGEVLKRLSFGTIIADHRRRLIEANDWFARTVDDVDASPQERAAAKRAFERRVATLGARRGIALNPDGLEAVARVYREAHQRGQPVQAAVAETFGIARSTAASRIMLARRAGLLPAATSNPRR